MTCLAGTGHRWPERRSSTSQHEAKASERSPPHSPTSAGRRRASPVSRRPERGRLRSTSGRGTSGWPSVHPMKTRILAGHDMTRLLEVVGIHEFMDLMIERLRARLLDHSAADVEVRPRDGFRYDKPALGFIEWMPTHEVGGPVVVKMVGYHPTNPVQRRLPSVLATTSMWDSESGHLTAIADATLLTAVAHRRRLGAGDRDPGPDRAAHRRDRRARRPGGHPAPRTVPGRDDRTGVGPRRRARGPEHLRRAGRLHRSLRRVGRGRAPAAARRESDVLCTCTSVDIGAGPVIPGDVDHRPWLHVNAVGADFQEGGDFTVEAGQSLLRRA